MDDPAPAWRPPAVWRALLWLARFLCAGVCRLRVSGQLPAGHEQGPLLLAANHIGAFDPVVLTAACARIGVAPRIMATGGLFRAPVFGTLMRRSGHVRVDRREAHVIDALGTARDALAERAVLLAYPEGRITLDPAMWPERGKTGLARLAMETGTPVVPVAQWGAHLVLPWGAPRGSLRRIGWSVLHRPVVRVHFGPPVDLADLSPALTVVAAATPNGATPGPPAALATGGPGRDRTAPVSTDGPGRDRTAPVSTDGLTAGGPSDDDVGGDGPGDDPGGDGLPGDDLPGDDLGDGDLVDDLGDGDLVGDDLGDGGSARATGGSAVADPAAAGNGRLAIGIPSAKAVRVGTDRIIEAIAVELAHLRPDEPRLPTWVDPARPVSSARLHRRIFVPRAPR